MKLRSSILYTIVPWLVYFIGETSGSLAIGCGGALLTMFVPQAVGWYRLKWTDWTQSIFFALVLACATWPIFHPALSFRPLLGPGLFLAMTVLSLAIGRPFTNQFAMEEIPADYWTDPAFPPHFARVNRILTSAWGLNFAVILLCAWLAREEMLLPDWVWKGIGASSFFAAVALTRLFPRWYEKNVYCPKPLPQNLSEIKAS